MRTVAHAAVPCVGYKLGLRSIDLADQGRRMGRGGYLGGSTVVKVWPTKKSQPRRKGLLQREADLAKHGVEPEGPLLVPKPKKPKAKRKTAPAPKPIPSAAPTEASPAPAAAIATGGRAKKNDPEPSFSIDQVLSYLGTHHPRCPRIVRKRIAKIAGEGRWKQLNIDRLAALSAEYYVVTDVCGVLRLIECGFDAQSANRMIAPHCKAVLALWGF